MNEFTKFPNPDKTFPGDDWERLQSWNHLSSGWDLEDGTHVDTVISALLNTLGGVFADTAEALSKLIGLFN
ncbi:hypothetical protein CATYP_09155 [Corynebacterium atypicum]|uniref:Uncharacterized protein n=1 Tax=Corynebacterium atypicum TaxID=191610 RepID=A0ABN4DE82_9CORY|nr:hypothetical protein [Corynebacterium atypicum]AIG64698.1 hypothetical protein CATYP_09155 [Corynebacterium atypicum]